MGIVTTNFKVEGMSCGHCTASIEKAVGALSGVQTVKADLAGKAATVVYEDTLTDPQAIAAAITDQGFDVV